MNRLQLVPMSSSPLCIEEMSWGRTLVMCWACFGASDFLRCGRELGGRLSGDIIWVVCVQCGRGLGGRLGEDIRESLRNFGHHDVAICNISVKIGKPKPKLRSHHHDISMLLGC